MSAISKVSGFSFSAPIDVVSPVTGLTVSVTKAWFDGSIVGLVAYSPDTETYSVSTSRDDSGRLQWQKTVKHTGFRKRSRVLGILAAEVAF